MDLCGLSDADAARQIHADAVNVLVDLDGFTRSSRGPALLGLRPAPLQVAYCGGCPLTRGLASAVQYVITDPVTVPKVFIFKIKGSEFVGLAGSVLSVLCVCVCHGDVP